MIEKTGPAGGYTLHGTSMTVSRMGYGAMQLAGRDGNKLVWGLPKRRIPARPWVMDGSHRSLFGARSLPAKTTRDV